jgi:hypothetical protein
MSSFAPRKNALSRSERRLSEYGLGKIDLVNRKRRPQEPPLSLDVFRSADFRDWTKVRWLLLLLVPILASSVAAFTRTRGGGFVVLAIGSAVSIFLFATLCSGVSRSNHGIYVRSQNPVAYWFDVAVLAAGYVLIANAGYWLKP